MKNKGLKLLAAGIAGIGIFMEMGWSFFTLTVQCKGESRTNVRKKWFRLSHAKVNHPRCGFEPEYEGGKSWCKEQEMQDCFIRSRDGLLLHAFYFPAENAKRIVLLSHGYKGSGFGDFANMAKYLHDHQCHLLFIDQRCCGKSEGEYITFGAKEQFDVQKWAYYLDERNKEHLPIYLYGESMGAAAVLMASGHHLPRNVRGLIADCGFRSMKGQLEDMARTWFHVRWIKLLLLRLNLFCRIVAGFRMKEADTSYAMKHNKRPILFFHGEADTFVDVKNTLHNYSVCRAPKEMVIIPHARHLCSNYVKPELYRKKILRFFQKHDTYGEPMPWA